MSATWDRGVAGERSRQPTLRDVAKQAGVHPSTASRALDPERARLVTERTRERVAQAAEMLGYRPDLVASALRRHRTRTVGVVVADLGNPFYTPVVHGASDVLDEAGYMTLVAESREDHARFRRVLDSFTSRRVDAVVTTAARRGDEPNLVALHRHVPVVLAARGLPGSPLPFVGHDDEQGGRLAARHLLDLGHRVLTQLPGPDDVESFVARTRGFEREIATAGGRLLAVADQAVAPTVEEGRRLMARALALPAFRPPAAVFAQNDLMAIGAIRELADRGFRCPEDVAVVGYNDSMFARHASPPLTTVYLPAYEIGQAAARIALTLIDAGGPHRFVGPGLLPPPKIVVRASTASVREVRQPARPAPV